MPIGPHEELHAAETFSPLNERCRLLELPAELRIRIFELTLRRDFGLQAYKYGRTDYIAAHPPLTSTNTQIRGETLPIFYGKNIICIQCSARFYNLYGLDATWLTQNGNNLRYLQRVRLDMIGNRDATPYAFDLAYNVDTGIFDVSTVGVRVANLENPYRISPEAQRMASLLQWFMAKRTRSSLSAAEFIAIIRSMQEVNSR